MSEWPDIVDADGFKCPGCGAPFEPICPTRGCDGRDEPLRIIRSTTPPKKDPYLLDGEEAAP